MHAIDDDRSRCIVREWFEFVYTVYTVHWTHTIYILSKRLLAVGLVWISFRLRRSTTNRHNRRRGRWPWRNDRIPINIDDSIYSEKCEMNVYGKSAPPTHNQKHNTIENRISNRPCTSRIHTFTSPHIYIGRNGFLRLVSFNVTEERCDVREYGKGIWISSNFLFPIRINNDAAKIMRLYVLVDNDAVGGVCGDGGLAHGHGHVTSIRELLHTPAPMGTYI